MIGVCDRSNILSSETMSCLRGDRQPILKSNRSDKRITDLDQKCLNFSSVSIDAWSAFSRAFDKMAHSFVSDRGSSAGIEA